jgi:hypothetical protein
VTLEFERNPGGYSITIPVEDYSYDVRVYNNGHVPTIEEMPRPQPTVTTTWTAEEFDRVLSTSNIPAVDWSIAMHPSTARAVFRQLENDLSTQLDEETSCL